MYHIANWSRIKISVARFLSILPSRKERKRDLCPDASRRAFGFLRGCRALPSAPHLDGQGHRGLRKRHLPVEETETGVPRCPFQRNQMPRRYILTTLVSFSPHIRRLETSRGNPFPLSITVYRPPESQLLQNFRRRNRKKPLDDQKQESCVARAPF